MQGLCLSVWVNGRIMEGVQCTDMVDGVALGQAIQTTFITSGTATVLATLIGVPLGAWCARQSSVHFHD